MSARTPGPWKLAEGHERSGADHYIWADALPGHAVPPDSRAICTVHADPDIDRVADANAAFIVMACNAHDELVAALLALLPGLELDLRYADPDDDLEAMRSRVKTVRAALAKVLP